LGPDGRSERKKKSKYLAGLGTRGVKLWRNRAHMGGSVAGNGYRKNIFGEKAS